MSDVRYFRVSRCNAAKFNYSISIEGYRCSFNYSCVYICQLIKNATHTN